VSIVPRTEIRVTNRADGVHSLSLRELRYVLPSKKVDTGILQSRFPDRNVTELAKKVGIDERCIAPEDVYASDLATAVCGELIEAIGDEAEVDMLLVCSQSPDHLIPSLASTVHRALCLKQSCGALDINAGCSGFVYCFGLAAALLASGQARHILFCTADVYSKYIREDDLSARLLFGDAATACLLSASDDPGIDVGPFLYGADGGGCDEFVVRGSGVRSFQRRVLEERHGTDWLCMNGKALYSFAIREVPRGILNLLTKAGLTLEEIDLMILHQANRAMLSDIASVLKYPQDRLWIAMDDVGNTVSSSIPIALRRAQDAGRLGKGSICLLFGFGVGFSWAGTIIRF